MVRKLKWVYFVRFLNDCVTNTIFFCYFRVKGYLTQKQHVEHYVLNLHIRTEIKKKGYLNRP